MRKESLINSENPAQPPWWLYPVSQQLQPMDVLGQHYAALCNASGLMPGLPVDVALEMLKRPPLEVDLRGVERVNLVSQDFNEPKTRFGQQLDEAARKAKASGMNYDGAAFFPKNPMFVRDEFVINGQFREPETVAYYRHQFLRDHPYAAPLQIAHELLYRYGNSELTTDILTPALAVNLLIEVVGDDGRRGLVVFGGAKNGAKSKAAAQFVAGSYQLMPNELGVFESPKQVSVDEGIEELGIHFNPAYIKNYFYHDYSHTGPRLNPCLGLIVRMRERDFRQLWNRRERGQQCHDGDQVPDFFMANDLQGKLVRIANPIYMPLYDDGNPIVNGVPIELAPMTAKGVALWQKMER